MTQCGATRKKEIQEEGATGGYGGRREIQRQKELNEEEALATATVVEEEHDGKLGQMDAVWC